MGQMMIMYSQIDALEGVEAEVTEQGISVTGDFEKVREYLEGGWYELDERGMNSDGEHVAYVVSEDDS